MGSLFTSIVSLISLNPIVFVICVVMMVLLALVCKRGKSIESIRESHNRRTLIMRQTAYDHIPVGSYSRDF